MSRPVWTIFVGAPLGPSDCFKQAVVPNEVGYVFDVVQRRIPIIDRLACPVRGDVDRPGGQADKHHTVPGGQVIEHCTVCQRRWCLSRVRPSRNTRYVVISVPPLANVLPVLFIEPPDQLNRLLKLRSPAPVSIPPVRYRIPLLLMMLAPLRVSVGSPMKGLLPT